MFQKINTTLYVGIAKDYGIVNGSNGKFNRRQDTMVMTANILKQLGVKVDVSQEVIEGFEDENGISGYARESVAILVNAGIITGSKGKINAKSDVTRAEMSIIISKLYDLIAAS